MTPRKVVITSALRTPIGSFMGKLSSVSAPKLGGMVIKATLEKINLDPGLIDEVIMGQVLQAGVGQAPARQAAIYAGIPHHVPATTVNRVCSSGMKAVIYAIQSIALGDADIVIAGGMENMSLTPHYLYSRLPRKFGKTPLIDGIEKDGLTDAYNTKMMGVFADMCAQKYNISRASQDAFAIESYKRTAQAWASGFFSKETIPVEVPQRRGRTTTVFEDEAYKDAKYDKIPTLSPAFSEDGTVTAANSSTMSDGAAALVLMSEEKAMALGISPLVNILSYAEVSCQPEWFTIAPEKALVKALKKTKIILNDIDFFEINEAFSLVSIVNAKLLNLNSDNVNVNGGAVSLGHPLGCSGARILVTLVNTLLENEGELGAASICNGGGGASSIIVSKG